MFSHSNAVSTPTRNVNLARILTALTKARIYNQQVRNCFSNISVFVMLMKHVVHGNIDIRYLIVMYFTTQRVRQWEN
jgi:hypothetical protein